MLAHIQRLASLDYLFRQCPEKPEPYPVLGIIKASIGGLPPLQRHVAFGAWNRLGSLAACEPGETKEVPNNVARRMRIRQEGSKTR